MDFKLGELESLFDQIKDIIEYVEAANLNDRRTTLYLSNGSVLTYCVPNFSIPHLLGIDTNYLSATGHFKTTNSFDLLKEIVDNPYKIHTLKNEGRIDYKQLFSEHIKEKIEAFKENIKINLYETEFICEYNKEKSFYTSTINENCDYIIVKKYGDDSIGVIYLAKNNSLCIPMSNRIFKSMDEAKEFLSELLKGQEITLINANKPYNIKTDYRKMFNLPLNYKAEKITELKKYKKIFNCSIDITKDYEHILDKLTSNRDTFVENDNIIEIIVNAIINKQIINRAPYIDSPLINIIDTVNDQIYNSQTSENTEGKSYTSIIKELEELKLKVTTLTKENSELGGKVDTLTEENNILQTQVNESQEREKQIIKILKPEN